jgi:glyoxylase-like metal-dependent hydrolase (beta-lactamase superfamily II)
LFAFGLEPVRVAPDVYAFLGDAQEISPANEGFVANTGFIVGVDGIIVIDSGSSYRFAAEMQNAIAKISRKPIRSVILTHATQEFIFGAARYQERGVPILTQLKSAELMRSRCDICLATLRRILGEDYMQGTRVVEPDEVVDASTTRVIAGRRIGLFHFGWGSTAGDLVVFDYSSGVAFAGGLVSAGRIPDLRDGDLRGWLVALNKLDKLHAKAIVPGFGPVIPPGDTRYTRDYLISLERAVRAQYRKGTSLLNVAKQTKLPSYAAAKQYRELHARNVQQVFLDVEREEFR